MDDLRERMRESVAQAIATNAGDCSLEEMIPTFRDQYLSDADAAITAALRYYAAHPEELLQEVVDAVRGMDGTVKATDPVRKVGTAEVVNALAESSLLNNTDWD